MSTNPACLYAFSEHDNIWKPVLPDHPPEVRNSVRDGSWNETQMENFMMMMKDHLCMHANQYCNLCLKCSRVST